MTIRVVTPPPAPPVYRGTCYTCRAEVEFDHDDGSASPDPREPGVRYIDCPMPTCAGKVGGSPGRR